MTDRLAKGKLILALLTLLSASLLCGFRLIGEAIYMAVVLGTVGGYLTAEHLEAKA
jgi:hypothetical protein